MHNWKQFIRNNRFWFIVIPVVPFVQAILFIGVLVTEDIFNHQPIEWTFYIINEFTGAFFATLLIPALLFFFHKYPIDKPIYKSLLLYQAVSIVYGVIFTSLMYGSRYLLYPLCGIMDTKEIFNNLPVRYLMEYFKQFIGFWLIYLFFYAYQQYVRNRSMTKRAADLKEELLKSQLNTLQMQLQPHFFFNTLNAVSSIMYDDPKRADRLISQMSGFLRDIIESSNSNLHSVEAEIKFLKKYTNVMKERYPNNLQVLYNISPDSLNQDVPILLLQPLVENAIKYAMGHAETTQIEIKTSIINRCLDIRIEDNGPGIKAGAFTKGTGLSSAIHRLELLYPGNHSFEMNNTESGLEIEISIPTNVAHEY